jgi:ABC-type glycerol-3-phosphate transport system permease component
MASVGNNSSGSRIKEQKINTFRYKRSQVMQELMSTLILVCAALASLALGVMLAYGLCRSAFAVFRIHAKTVAAEARRKTTVAARA